MIIMCNVIIFMYGVVIMFFDGGGGGGGGAPFNHVSLKLLLKTWQLCYIHVQRVL